MKVFYGDFNEKDVYPSLTENERKGEILSEAMVQSQPSLRDFLHAPGYTRKEIYDDEKYINKKEGTFDYGGDDLGANDKYSKYAEPLLAYILNNSALFPTRNNFARLASRYDDLAHGTDVFFGVENKKTKEDMVFSVDVATGTSMSNIEKKFKQSGTKHGDTPEMTAQVKYCLYGDKKWKEPEAPQFILGLAPASIENGLSLLKVSDYNIDMKKSEYDLNTNFMVLSEIFEQTRMQLAILGENPEDDSALAKRISNLTSLRVATVSALYQALGVNKFPKEVRDKEFSERYKKGVNFFKSRDAVYNNIISVAKRQANAARGRVGLANSVA